MIGRADVDAAWYEGDVTVLGVEPEGCPTLAALLSGAYRPQAGELVGVVLCGANADPATLSAA